MSLRSVSRSTVGSSRNPRPRQSATNGDASRLFSWSDGRSVKRPLTAYIVLAYALSIGLSVIVWLTGGDRSPLAIAFGAGAMFVPAAAVLVVVMAMNAPPPTLRWGSLPLGYVPLALFLIPVVMHVVMLPAASAIWGGLPWVSWLTPQADGLYHTPPDRNWGVLTLAGLGARVALNMVVGLIATSVLAFFEEVGWRAWMLPRLLERTTTRRAVVSSAIVWAFWHTPFALSGIHHLPGISPVLLAVTMPIGTVGAGLIIGWLWVRTESIVIVALAHGALNNWGQYAFKLMQDGGAGGHSRDLLVLAAGGFALVVVGSCLLTAGTTSASLMQS